MIDLLLKILIFPGVLFIGLTSLIIEWLERKCVAYMQSRVGPTYTGPQGILQPLADFIKLLSKEDIVPRGADEFMVDLSLVLIVSLATFNLFFIPFTGQAIICFEGDLLVSMLLASVTAALIFILGWSYASPFTRVGALRLVMQVIGFDIVLILMALIPAIETGTLSITNISKGIWSALGSRPLSIIPHYIAMVIFIIGALAEIEGDPFDIPEAKQEVVAGYLTEVSGRKLALLHLARDMMLFRAFALASAIFVGIPFKLPMLLSEVVYAIILLIETILVAILGFSIKASTSRLRIQDLLDIFWRKVLPLSLLLVLVVCMIRVII